MKTGEKLLVYPYGSEFTPILRHKGLLSYEICGLVSPPGVGLAGKDAGEADHGGKIGITVSDNFFEMLDASDTVMIADFIGKLDFRKSIYPKIISAINAGKNIACTLQLDKETEAEIHAMCDKAGVCFKYYEAPDMCMDVVNSIAGKGLINIDVPVVFVFGLCERTGKFGVQLALREELRSIGYKVSQVGSRRYCELLGFHSFPGFMYDSGISEEAKILLFNRFVKSIEMIENPDLIVIGIPGGVMPYSSKFTTGFGVTAFEVANAVPADASICSVTYNEGYKPEFYNSISNVLRYKLNLPVDCFNLSNTKIQEEHSKINGNLIYFSINPDMVEHEKAKLSHSGIPLFNLLNANDVLKASDLLVRKLAGYSEIEFI